MTRGPRRLVRLAALGWVALTGMMLDGGWRSLAGQGSGAGAARLELAEAALAEARFEEARAALQAWWEDGEGGRDRVELQQALWLRARLTVDPDAAELLYRRLIVEFPGGAWSDQALLRLAAGATARNESATARRYLEILVRDYPASPFRVEARATLARMTAEPSAPAPASVPAPAAVSAPAPAPVPDGAFTLQFGAFGERDRAETVATELRLAGIETRVVQTDGSPLFRVRSGAFPSREAAELRARDLEARGFELLISADREQEREPDS